MTENKYITLLIIFFIFSFCCFAKSENGYKKADSLRLSYKFSEAISLYESTLKQGTDSLSAISIQGKIIECKNGLSLLNFSMSPKVITSKDVPLNNFFLYFSQLKNHSWIDIPNPLIKKGNQKYYKAIYFPETFKKLLFSAPNKLGDWDIYETELIDKTLWSEPKIIQNLASPGDEIFPILSPDKKELYFASNGHYGMGGYDLYVSKWDESINGWGIPENLGFPYSSVADDIFYMTTPDGKYSMLASNRNTSTKDSIRIYVTEFSPAPIKTKINDIAQIREIAKLSPPLRLAKIEYEKTTEKKGISKMDEYSAIIAEMRNLQEKHDAILSKQKTDRELFKTLTIKKEKIFLQEIITENEEKALKIRLLLDKATVKIQEAEIEFLAKGVIPELEDPSIIIANKALQKEKLEKYSFQKLKLGKIRTMEVKAPAPKYDYGFKIKKFSTLAENQAIPTSLIYQIQVSVNSKKTSLKNFNGICPVFQKKAPSGKYIYTVGLFKNYTEARAALSKVARRGFPKAYLVTFNNGKSIPLKNARILEKKLKESMTYQVALRNFPNGLSSPIVAAIKESSDKDIVKTYQEGEIVYAVGPFEKESDANYVITILSGLGIKGISIEHINL